MNGRKIMDTEMPGNCLIASAITAYTAPDAPKEAIAVLRNANLARYDT